jgi:2-polyprenyl-3-methyl-5-hydroxy-6-metoxy-1,4-benzoquinol methylase
MNQYYFKYISKCEMCNDETSKHKILGQRLNQSQGFNPKNKIGITVSILKCNNCGLIYSNPQPIPNNLQDHYGSPPEQYWKPEYFKIDPNYFSTQIKECKSLLNFKENMKALDIGAGLGKAMIALNNAGYDTYGFEPSIPFYERALSIMKIDKNKLKLGAIEEMEYEKEHFDFITFGAVFEHLYEPSICLEKAMSWLKPNGIMHMEIPSSRWFIPKIINLYYTLIGTNYVTNLSPMHSPFHLHEFDLKSFEKLSKKLNFSIIQHRFDVCSIYFFPKFLHPILKLYMKYTNKGMQLTVYLKKNN